MRQIYHNFYKFVSLYEAVQIGEELFSKNPFHVELDETVLLYDFSINDDPYEIGLHETVTVNDVILVNGINDAVQEVNNVINLDERILFSDYLISLNPFDVKLSEEISLYTEIKAIDPLEPSINPEIQMIKSGFLITENPKFELEYYSKNDAVKIDHQQIVNATSIANQLQAGLSSTPSETLNHRRIK